MVQSVETSDGVDDTVQEKAWRDESELMCGIMTMSTSALCMESIFSIQYVVSLQWNIASSGV